MLRDLVLVAEAATRRLTVLVRAAFSNPWPRLSIRWAEFRQPPHVLRCVSFDICLEAYLQLHCVMP
eukprot:2743720-Amphidinium_carterae.1